MQDVVQDLHVRLQQHLSSDTPCDYLCTKCGSMMDNRISYIRHKSKECSAEGLTDTQLDELDKERNSMHAEVVNNTFNGDIMVNNGITFNIYNTDNAQKKDIIVRKIKDTGIYRIESEQEYLLEYHFTELNKLFENYLKKTKDIQTSTSHHNLRILFKDVMRVFHSNCRTPQFMNIINVSSNPEKNMIYSGTQFIDDVMSIRIRNRRVIQLIKKQLLVYMKDINVLKSTHDFLYHTFIPYLTKIYHSEDIQDEFQEAWKHNSNVLNTIDYKKYPIHPQYELKDSDIEEQVEDYTTQNNGMLESLLRRELDESNRMIQSVSGKQLNYVKN